MTNHQNRNKALAHWADVRNTSIEIARVIKDTAINRLANDDLTLDDAMQALWEAPSDAERDAVVAGAFELTDEDVLHWGEETFSRPTAA